MGDTAAAPMEAPPIFKPQVAVASRKRSAEYDQVKLPGEPIPCETGFLRGHGTFIEKTVLTASVCGVLEETNKLKAVRPLKSRYVGEVGDVVVGRVNEVGQNRWKLDINSHQDGILMLSAVNLPGGAQRRRTAEDQLQMRNFFVENDAVCMEVQAINGDGSLALHTRSERYGKLHQGVFLRVQPSLIKRSSQHVHQLACGVSAILGNNGYVWLSPSMELIVSIDGKVPASSFSAEQFDHVARVRNAIVWLAQEFMLISAQSVMDVYNASLQSGIEARAMLGDWRPLDAMEL